ncbi:MAG: MFS transporter [Clostridia bacterium]|nr:MFS transporter [Clostridia bacterium]
MSETAEKKIAARNAVMLGGMCALAYLAVYVVRNVLSTVTPSILSGGFMSTEQVGTLSSVFFIAYAVGQLINGIIGDRIPAKFMLGAGLLMAGVSHLVLTVVLSAPLWAYVAYAATGFFLSMVYGPMTKVVAENVHPLYAPRCSLGYTFSSLLGSPAAGVLAMVLSWQGVFVVGSSALVAMGVAVFVAFCLYERHGIIRPRPPVKETHTAVGGIKVLLRRHIVKFSLVSIITGVIRTTVVFWLPTYLAQHLHYTEQQASGIFSVATLLISFTAFVAVFAYERLGHNMHVTVLLAFVLSALCFAGVYFVPQPLVNTILLVAAIFCSNCAASILWSCYCPSLWDTGMVSTATGFLDFLSYMAAAASSSLFAGVVDVIGWQGLILIWLGLLVAGVLVAIPWRRKKI